MNTLTLLEHHFIGSGANKKCFTHPNNEKLCIKIIYSNNDGNSQKELQRELRYYQVLQNKNHSPKLLPNYYGEIETNLGIGYVYDVIRDYDKNISRNLDYYFSSPDLLEHNFANICYALKKMKEEMLQENLITMGLYPPNILYKKENEKEATLVIIDNIGTGSLIPLEYYFNFFARARVLRRWKRFMEDIELLYPSPLIKKLITKVNQ